jgi:hypothetical protein
MRRRDGYRSDHGDDVTRPFDDDAAERLLAGRVPGDDPESALLAAAIADLRGMADGTVPRHVADRHVAAAAAEALEHADLSARRATAPRRSWIGRSVPALATRVVVIVAAVVALSAGAAVAGVLPAPMQRAFSELASLFRFDVALPQDPVDTTAPVAGDDVPIGPPVTTTTTTPEEPPPVTTTTTVVAPPPEIILAMAPDSDAVAESGRDVTFDVEVTNTGVEPVTLLELIDDVFGDLRDRANEAITDNTCAQGDANLDPGEVFSCSFTAFIAGEADGPDHRSTTTVVVADGNGIEAFAALTARVAFLPITVAIGVEATPSVVALDEPGGIVTIDVRVVNRSTVPATLTLLEDSVFGDLLDPDSQFVFNNTCPLAAAGPHAPGAAISCRYDTFIPADAVAGGSHHTTVAALTGSGPTTVSASSAFSIDFVDVLPEISVTAAAGAIAVSEPGEWVQFTVELRNDSVEPVLVTALTYAGFGDLLQLGNPGLIGNTCALQGRVIGVGDSLVCGFSAEVIGDEGDDPRRLTVSAAAVDNEGNEATATHETAIGFTSDGTRVGGRVLLDLGSGSETTMGLSGIRVRVTVPGIGTITVATNEHGEWTAVVTPGEVTVRVVRASVPAALSLKTGNTEQVLTAVSGTFVSATPIGYGPGT